MSSQKRWSFVMCVGAMLISILCSPAIPCGVNPKADTVASEKRLKASRPVSPEWVSSPGFLERLWQSRRWEHSRAVCLAQQKDLSFVCCSTLNCALGASSCEILATAAGDPRLASRKRGTLTTATLAVRIPQEYLDLLAEEGFVTKNPVDPGMGPGSGENYCLVQKNKGEAGLELQVICLVHGADTDDRTLPARAQLAALGIKDEALLAAAWNVVPRPHPAGGLRLLALVLWVLLALAGWRFLRPSWPAALRLFRA